MFVFNSLFDAIAPSLPDNSRFTFTALFLNYSGSTMFGRQDLILYENTNIDRINVIYDSTQNVADFKYILKPREFSLTANTSGLQSFNTVAIIDDGSVSFGTTVNRYMSATWLGNTATLFGFPSLQFRNGHVLVNPITNAFAQTISDNFGSATLASSIGSPSQVYNAGRYLVGLYQYKTNITTSNTKRIRIKLGNINIKLR